MELKEFKKELSKLTGTDMFNPRYRELFKRYFEDGESSDEEDIEKSKIDIKENGEDSQTNRDREDESVGEQLLDKGEEDSQTAKDRIDESEGSEKADKENIEETSSDDDWKKTKGSSYEGDLEKKDNINYGDELLDAKIEIGLLKAGIREDRIESARKLLKIEIETVDDIVKIPELIKQYPEWIKTTKSAEPFGISIGERGDGLTAEERRLKDMGIDPRG